MNDDFADIVSQHKKQVDISVERLCVPQPVIQHIIKEAIRGYIPEFTIVNKCRCGDVCENSSHRCVAVRSRKVTKLFQVVNNNRFSF